ncbi:cytochrome P450 [Gonapodya prolifera JEL478]|uniref:Cytochrome P450 n=1 Tax=Gonapodya prolifera (strain JEL478) TaxID=1344416 RepID=A0A139A994_GONPJ|nr:cytochrome P450 [Gonapodya prolifera JEL478]|eukprot:KXS13392.1 cytochrome P450 [Gonapodya prolifera JEL478]
MQDAETQRPLTDTEIAVHVRLFLLAGVETTANAMAWKLLFLIRNPAALMRLRDDLDAAFPDGMTHPLALSKLKAIPWLNACVKETLRLKPILPAMFRIAKADTDLSRRGIGFRRGHFLGRMRVLRIETQVSTFLNARSGARRLPRKRRRRSRRHTHSKGGGCIRKGISAEQEHSGPAMLNQRAYMPFSVGSRCASFCATSFGGKSSPRSLMCTRKTRGRSWGRSGWAGRVG